MCVHVEVSIISSNFYHVGLKDQPQVIRLGSKHLYSPIHPLALGVLRQGLAKLPTLLLTYSIAQASLELVIFLLQSLASVLFIYNASAW